MVFSPVFRALKFERYMRHWQYYKETLHAVRSLSIYAKVFTSSLSMELPPFSCNSLAVFVLKHEITRLYPMWKIGLGNVLNNIRFWLNMEKTSKKLEIDIQRNKTIRTCFFLFLFFFFFFLSTWKNFDFRLSSNNHSLDIFKDISVWMYYFDSSYRLMWNRE